MGRAGSLMVVGGMKLQRLLLLLLLLLLMKMLMMTMMLRTHASNCWGAQAAALRDRARFIRLYRANRLGVTETQA